MMAACSNGGPTGPGDDTTPPTPVGAYTLARVDQQALPWTMYSASDYTLEVQAATLTITADGKWVSKYTTRETVAGFVSIYADSSFGTWTATASTKIAVLTNAETLETSSASWTAGSVTVQQLDGATVHVYNYDRN
jgi:hypothetical protein